MITIFPDRLKHLRENSGLTQKELAKRLNLTQSTIAYYENGRKMPTLENAILLAKIFDTSLDYLIGRTNFRNGETNTNLKLFSDMIADDINTLSPEGQKDLKDFIKFLKFRDRQIEKEKR